MPFRPNLPGPGPVVLVPQRQPPQTVGGTVTWTTSQQGSWIAATFRATQAGVPIIEKKKATAAVAASTTCTATWEDGGTATAGNLIVCLCCSRDATDKSYVLTGFSNNGTGWGAILTKTSDGSETGVTVTVGVSGSYRIAAFELANCGAWDKQSRPGANGVPGTRFVSGTGFSFQTPPIAQADEWAGALIGWSGSITGGSARWSSGWSELFQEATSSGASQIIPGGRVLSPYEAAVMADQPVLYWRLGEPEGYVLDWSGRDRHADQILGSPVYNANDLVEGA